MSKNRTIRRAVLREAAKLVNEVRPQEQKPQTPQKEEVKTQKPQTTPTNMNGGMRVTITNRRSRGHDVIRIKSTEITIPLEMMKAMNVEPGDFILTAVLGDMNFLGRRPKGLFGGTKIELYQPPGKEEETEPIGKILIKSTSSGQTVGEYKLGKSFTQPEKTVQGNDVTVTFWTLTPLDREEE